MSHLVTGRLCIRLGELLIHHLDRKQASQPRHDPFAYMLQIIFN